MIVLLKSSTVLRGCTVFKNVLSFARYLFTVFEKHVCYTFETLLRVLLKKGEFLDGYSHDTLTFVRSFHVQRGYVMSVDHFGQGKCRIMKADVWPQKVLWVSVTSASLSSRSSKNSIVLLGVESVENTSRWVARVLFLYVMQMERQCYGNWTRQSGWCSTVVRLHN